MKDSPFMRFWNTVNQIMRSHNLPEMRYGEARDWYQQHLGWEGGTMTAHWPYYTLRSDGILVDDSGYVAFPVPHDEIAASLLKGWGKKAIQPHPFVDVAEAEAWLKVQDLRGNVRG